MNEPLRQAMLRAGLREDDVAARLGVDPKTVRRWLSGRVPYRNSRLALANLVGANEADLWPDAGGPLTSRPRPEELTAVYPHRSSIPRDVWKRLFESAEHEIGILAYSALFLAEDADMLTIIADKARSGVRVRLALGDPDGTAVTQRGQEDGVGDAMGAKVRNALKLYRAALKVENVEIRLHDTVLYNSLYRADDQLFVNQHAYGLPPAGSPVFTFRTTDETASVLEPYLRSFETVWTGSLPLAGPLLRSSFMHPRGSEPPRPHVASGASKIHFMTDPQGSTAHTDPIDDVKYLRTFLGSPFVEWVLANTGDSFTEAQMEVARTIAAILRQYSSENPELPTGLLTARLLFFYEPAETTFLNYCRRYAGGRDELQSKNAPDRLLSAFTDFAVQCYGEMLLPTHMGLHGPSFHSHIKTDPGRNLVDAIYEAGIFPLMPEPDYGDVPQVRDALRSTQPGWYASQLLWAAWNLAKLEVSTPILDKFTAKIPEALRQLRSLLSGEITMITATASLTGVRIPDDAEFSGAWGKVRPARPEDHPSAFRDLISRRTATTADTGDRIEISDAGDVIFEAAIPVQLKISSDETGWSYNTLKDFGEIVDKARLAFALAVQRPSSPVIFTVWSMLIMPIGSMEPPPLMDARSMAQRVPILLSGDELASWQRWIDIIMSTDMSRLKVAMTRTLQAMTERRDPADRLIDAVIAWESLFGATNESTLRVSASLALFLHPTVHERESWRKTYSRIYQARSDIVHANETSTTKGQIDEYGRTAINATLRTIAQLLTTHASLLPLKSSTRSTQILLGVSNPASDEEIEAKH